MGCQAVILARASDEQVVKGVGQDQAMMVDAAHLATYLPGNRTHGSAQEAKNVKT